ncbi:hypothetical protein K1719_005629 [Acacia pycnantha]|nr:hypothetical protein K1719_005629 [Acacia pycnantha]
MLTLHSEDLEGISKANQLHFLLIQHSLNSDAEDRQGVPCAPTVSAAANSVGAVPLLIDYCNSGTCQIQCGGGAPPPAGGLIDIISRDTFNQMLMHRDDSACPSRGFYTYDAFIEAAKSFPAFGSTGDVETRKREIAAFLGQTSHETSGGWASSPDGPYAWGYCFNKEPHPSTIFCAPSPQFPCVPGRQYYGRGPFQISWNLNYGLCGKAIGVDLLNNPDLVATDAVISFKTALWFWMRAVGWTNIPSCHDVMTGIWTPSAADRAAGRLPGYGATTNIISGGLECGRGKKDPRVEDRIGFYKRYCNLLAIGYGSNLDCYSMKPFGSSSSLLHAPI